MEFKIKLDIWLQESMAKRSFHVPGRDCGRYKLCELRWYPRNVGDAAISREHGRPREPLGSRTRACTCHNKSCALGAVGRASVDALRLAYTHPS